MKLVTLAEIASGGMGSVELARAVDGRLAGQLLAVKRLNEPIAQDPDFVAMFLDEAWMTYALNHPNVAAALAWATDERGQFLGIELVQGISLARLIKEAQANKEPFAERTVAFIGSQICAGLIAAHSLTGTTGEPLGLVHRDLSPANLLVSFDGVVKIIDFGIARAEERITHTRTGQMKGKPAYMAPEQQRPGTVDLRADLFSFGVCMFELLTGRRPWTQKGAFDVMMAIATTEPPSLAELRPNLNPDLVTIVHKCLQKKPADRYSSAAEIKALLDDWLVKKGFAADDQKSLENFVIRNSAPQLKWFERAIAGDLQKEQELTFKDLEEQIDEAREGKVKKRPPVRPAAGRAPSMRPPPAATQPMAAYTGDAQPTNVVAPGALPRPAPLPTTAFPAVDAPVGLGGTQFMGNSPVPSGSIPPPPPGPPPPGPGGAVGLGGTQFLGASPLPSGSIPPPPMGPPPGPPPPGGRMASIPPPSPGANVDALAATAMASEGLPLPPNLSGSSPGILSGSSPGILSGSSPNALAGSSPGSARSPFEARTVAPLVPAKPVAPQGSAGKIALILIMIFVPLIGLGVGAWVYYSSPPAKGPGPAPAAPAPKKK